MGAEADERRLGVVFVHGFLSSSETWNPITSLIAGDPELERVDPLLFDYESRLWQPDPRRRIPTLRVVADMLKEFLDSQTEGHRRLALVGHSQGGLVIQYCLARMLGEGRGKDLARIRRVVFFACPNSGTQWGAAFRRGLLKGNPQERDLRPLNEEITEARRVVMRDIVRATEVTERTCPIPFAVFAGQTDNIVPPASAQDVFPDVSVLPGDHNGIIRPDTREHLTYAALRRHLVLCLPDPPVDGAAVPAGSVEEPPAPLPQHAPAVQAPGPVLRTTRPLHGGHAGEIWFAGFTRDGKTLATFGGKRPTVLLWDMTHPQPNGAALIDAQFRPFGRKLTHAVFSPDGSVLVTARDMRPGPEQFTAKKLQLWDTATRRPLGEIRVSQLAVVSGLAYSPRGDLLAVAPAATPIHLWNPVTRKRVRTLRHGFGTVEATEFSPDGRTLVASSYRDGEMRMWDVDTGRPVGEPLVGHTAPVRGIVFSPDGALLATRAIDRTVRIWDVRTLRQVRRLGVDPRDLVYSLAFSPDGHDLLTGTSGGRVTRWDAATGERRGEDLLVDSAVMALAFTPAGALLAATGGTVPRVYEWDPAPANGR
ncbi:alpha/beta fold hydrolase [Streptomyces goshikiensis]|uniref:alpha/beta fold hydrolase n=1 Tax=Streptomyces goshikiensis TaxID=1942 RepID=UPI0036634F68